MPESGKPAKLTSDKTTVELYSVGVLPPFGEQRWKYLANPDCWNPVRQQLHETLLLEVTEAAMEFAETVSKSGAESMLYAMRGNTAVGKTRTSSAAIPVLAEGLKNGGGGCVNPDIFKTLLRQNSDISLTSVQVHAESCVLADKLEERLSHMKTENGAPASMLIDKRLAYPGEIERYIGMAEKTGRKITLCDIDADLEKSLIGVLERSPDGPDPLPHFAAVGAGFSAVRSNRITVIDKIIANPGLGSYQLYGTAANGEKVKVASVEYGELTILEPELYAATIAAPSDAAALIGSQVIDEVLISSLTESLRPDRQQQIAKVLRPYLGKTWQEAIDAHSQLST